MWFQGENTKPYGEDKHGAILAELPHNARKWETEEKSSTAQPREAGFVVWAEAETLQSTHKFETDFQ